ncbi:hypothetical protein ACFQ9Y_20065 [Peribacillus simplex]|uniref:hypothetical protein n=1 Tax=Peribacillus simplex TaxID=1478 RepID=UPI00366F8F67
MIGEVIIGASKVDTEIIAIDKGTLPFATRNLLWEARHNFDEKVEFIDDGAVSTRTGNQRKRYMRNNTTPSSLDRWIHEYKKYGSFQENDNSSLEQEELLMLHKELEQQ